MKARLTVLVACVAGTFFAPTIKAAPNGPTLAGEAIFGVISSQCALAQPGANVRKADFSVGWKLRKRNNATKNIRTLIIPGQDGP